MFREWGCYWYLYLPMACHIFTDEHNSAVGHMTQRVHPVTKAN